MLLRQVIGKELFVKDAFRGVCVGVGVSKKNNAVKYLLCSSSTMTIQPRVDFIVNFSAINEIFSGGLHLSSLRPVYPKNAFFIFPSLPVYTHDGVNVGVLEDGIIKDGILKKITVNDKKIAFSNVSACADAVILKAPKPYPLGIPMPDGNGQVTKLILKNAVKNGNLISFTLSLAPFCLKAN